jgi:hypothetical protein
VFKLTFFDCWLLLTQGKKPYFGEEKQDEKEDGVGFNARKAAPTAE